jgi:hypothetical protein
MSEYFSSRAEKLARRRWWRGVGQQTQSGYDGS